MSKRLLFLTTAIVGLLAIAAIISFNQSNQPPRSQTQAQTTQLPAFPGAEGAGAYAQGGRGGRVIKVTNLNNSGSGSLRDCVDASGPRTCIFDISGTIMLTKTIIINNPYLTIAGQSAPGDGITIRGSRFTVRTHNVIIRHLRLRHGSVSDVQADDRDSLSINARSDGGRVSDIMVDHSSLSWGTDETMEIYNNFGHTNSPSEITVQWSLVTEALTDGGHSEGNHALGLLVGAGTNNVSIHHNLFSHNLRRNPRLVGGRVDVINNVIYDTTAHTQVIGDKQAVVLNYIGNYEYGNRGGAYAMLKFESNGSYFNQHRMYVEGNIGKRRTSLSQDEWLITAEEIGTNQPVARRSIRVSSSHPLLGVPVNIQSYSVAKNSVFDNAGATMGIDNQGIHYFRRDSVDIRVINQARNETGGFIGTESDVGGYPKLAEVARPSSYDSDHDGMADAWEISHFNSTTVSGHPLNAHSLFDQDQDGYTDLEEFLNNTDPGQATNKPAINPSPTPTTNIQTPSHHCDHTLNSSTTTLTQSLNGQPINPGDTICIPSGTRGSLRINDLHGRSGNPITIINTGGPATINSHENWGIYFQGSSHIILTGTGVSNQCGSAYSASNQNCGIILQKGTNGIRTDTNVTNIEIYNVEIRDTSVGIKLIQIDSGQYREYYGGVVKNTYIHDTTREGMYLGVNYGSHAQTTFINDLEVAHNLTLRTGWRGIGTKSVRQIDVHHNIVIDSGFAPDTRAAGHRAGISAGVNSHMTNGRIYSNCIHKVKENGIGVDVNQVHITNNQIYTVGGEYIKEWVNKGGQVSGNTTGVNGTCDTVPPAATPTEPPAKPTGFDYLTLSPTPTSTKDAKPDSGPSLLKAPTPSPPPDAPYLCQLGSIVANLISVSLGLAGLASFFMLIYGSLAWLTAGASPDKLQHARMALLWAFIGLVLIIASFFILQLISNFTGVDVTSFSIPWIWSSPTNPASPCST
jgi:pectate lyase